MSKSLTGTDGVPGPSSDLAGRLEWLRNHWGLSFAAMDTRVGISAGSFNRYINDDRQPTAPAIRKLCEQGVSPAWLVMGTGAPFVTPDPSPSVARVEYGVEALLDAVRALGRATAALAPILSDDDRKRLLGELAGLSSGLAVDPLA